METVIELDLDGRQAAQSELDVARRRASQLSERASDTLAVLPRPALRSLRERAAADSTKNAMRTMRCAFLDAQVDAVYDEITFGRTHYLRLANWRKRPASPSLAWCRP